MRTLTGVLTITDDDGKPYAEVLLLDPHPLAALIGKVPCSTFTLYRVAAELFETGQIG